MIPILLNWPFPIYSYPLFLGLAWGFGYNYSLTIAEQTKIDKFRFQKYILGLFISIWMGAKIFFWIFSAERNPLVITSVSFWLGGGFVFFGGLMFGTIFTILHNHFFKLINIEFAAKLLPGLCLSHAIGRIGCFLAGCCFGRTWDIHGGILGHTLNKHPVQLYEVILLIFIFLILNLLIKKKYEAMQIILSYFMIYAGGRFLLEYVRADAIRGVYGPFSSSQWIALTLLVLSCMLFLRERIRRSIVS